MDSTCIVTSPGLASTSALWTWAPLLPTLASVPRTGSLRYPGSLCLYLYVPECPCLGPGSLQEKGRQRELELALFLLSRLVVASMNI